jgi:hypothetical protein
MEDFCANPVQLLMRRHATVGPGTQAAAAASSTRPHTTLQLPSLPDKPGASTTFCYSTMRQTPRRLLSPCLRMQRRLSQTPTCAPSPR